MQSEIRWILRDFNSLCASVKPDPENPPSGNNPQAGNVPPLLPASEPPVIGAPPPLTAASPSPLPPLAKPKSVSARNLLAILLSLSLGLFLADAGLATKKRTQKLCKSLVNCFGFRSQWGNGSRASCAGVGGCKTL
ncbi:MAG: hypothetical protein ACLQU4_06370, partial [Limisphaerales bacterium]